MASSSPSVTKPIHGFRFGELNLRHQGNAKNTTDLVSRAIRMGYDAVAINIDVGDPFVDRVQQTLEVSYLVELVGYMKSINIIEWRTSTKEETKATKES